jgi:pyruvate, orthophosphate dikinase
MPERRRYVYDFAEPLPLAAEDRPRLLGGKGSGLALMAHDLRLPVPPGFTITTEACLAYMAGRWPPGLDDEVRSHMDRLGQRMRRRFGDAADPLLVSVRSGAPLSMPGMMDTILNLGLNETMAAGLASSTGDIGFATDCRVRFEHGYRDVIGSDRVPDDPWVQLRAAIEAVFRSWNSDRARTYRRRERIPDDLGTAATVQAMVFGNRGADSGTGVLFTRNPSTGEASLYGDVMFGAQGEDVVAGTHNPEPLSVLDERIPPVAAELRRYAQTLERHFADLCDIEFTIEQGRLWLLQVRVGKRSPRASLRMAIDMALDESFPLSREQAVRRVAGTLADPPRVFVPAGEMPSAIATGLPASPGIATGAVVLSSEAAQEAAAAGTRVILVRHETSVEDVAGMSRAAGVLTARGGLASHAAVVARGWGIPAVVGVSGVEVGDAEVRIDGRTIAAGDTVTIDGSTGDVYLDVLAGSWQVAPEAATLLEWAAELDVEIKPAEATIRAAPEDAARAELTNRALPRDDILRVLLIKGSVTPDMLTEALFAGRDRLDELAAQLMDEGLVESAAGALRLSPQGKLKALSLYEADRGAVGEQRCSEFLEAFHAFDVQVKEFVTAWQVRDMDGEQVLNDHTDAQYDNHVLERMTMLHGRLCDWLAPLAAALDRYAVYRSRLSRALERAGEGDQGYVASPRVDSYHSVWFELHEDLIRLAGRRRSDEAAAGRA